MLLTIIFFVQLIKRKTARKVFKTLHIERWAFDVEMLKVKRIPFFSYIFIASTLQMVEMLGLPLSEVAVRWQEIDGSKLNPVLAAIQMFKDIFLLWLRYAIGAWRLPDQKKGD